MKSNKSDISMLMKCIDSVQINLKHLSNMSVSTLRVINYSLMEEDLTKSDKNRQMVLKNLQNFYQQMMDFRIGDVAVGNWSKNSNNVENNSNNNNIIIQNQNESKRNKNINLKNETTKLENDDEINDRDRNINLKLNISPSISDMKYNKVLRQSINITPMRDLSSK